MTMTALLPSRCTTRPSRSMKLAWVLCIGLFCMGSTRSVAAQKLLLFPPEQFGKANLSLPQSTYFLFLESLLDRRRDHFEDIRRFREDDRHRKLSKAVGRLQVSMANGFSSVCTASLIAEDLLLTNYHCIPG